MCWLGSWVSLAGLKESHQLFMRRLSSEERNLRRFGLSQRHQDQTASICVCQILLNFNSNQNWNVEIDFFSINENVCATSVSNYLVKVKVGKNPTLLSTDDNYYFTLQRNARCNVIGLISRHLINSATFIYFLSRWWIVYKKNRRFQLIIYL